MIVRESLIDALSFWAHGQRHVTSAYGVQGFTAEHLAALKEHGVGRVLIAFDRDEAGDTAAAKLADRLGGEGIDYFRVLLPAGQDANALATSSEDPAGALADVLRCAVWMGAGQPPARSPVTETSSSAAPAHAQPEPRPEGGEGEEADGAPAEAVSVSAAQPPASEPASPVPAGPAAGPAVRLEGEELHVGLDDRRWRVCGPSAEPRAPGRDPLSSRPRARSRMALLHSCTLRCISVQTRARRAASHPQPARRAR